MIAFEDILKVFKSHIKSTEILYLLFDLKKVVRQGFYEEELSLVKTFCKQQSLFCIQSQFKVLIADTHKDISDKGLRVSKNDPRKGMFFVYFSKDEKRAYQTAYAEIIQDETELGVLLEYPRCCISYFIQEYRGEDLTLPPTNLYTNLTKRKDDCCLLSHFPCSSNCQKSIRIAQKRLLFLQKYYPEIAKSVSQTLTP